MSNVDAWAAILGAVTPWLVAVVAQPQWSPAVKRLLAIGFSVVIAVIDVLVQGAFDLSNWLVTAAVILGVAQTTYALFKPAVARVETLTFAAKLHRG